MDKRHKQTFHQRRNTSMRGTLGPCPEMQFTSYGFPDHTQSHYCFSMFISHVLESGITHNTEYQQASQSHLMKVTCEHVSRVC